MRKQHYWSRIINNDKKSLTDLRKFVLCFTLARSKTEDADYWKHQSLQQLIEIKHSSGGGEGTNYLMPHLKSDALNRDYKNYDPSNCLLLKMSQRANTLKVLRQQWGTTVWLTQANKSSSERIHKLWTEISDIASITCQLLFAHCSWFDFSIINFEIFFPVIFCAF